MNKRMSLSLIALIGSVFMFVLASFAWLQISGVVSIFGPSAKVDNIQTHAILFASADGTNFTETEAILISSGEPGNVYYFQVIISNTGELSAQSRVLLFGFTDGLSDPEGTDTGYLEGKSLVEVMRVSASNSLNTDVIDDVLMIDLLPGEIGDDFTQSYLTLLDTVTLEVGQSITLNVTFTLDELTGNEYQNLSLLISSISVQSISE